MARLTPAEQRKIIDGCNALAGTPMVETLEYRVATTLRNAAAIIRGVNTDDNEVMDRVQAECTDLARQLVPLTDEVA